MSTPRLTQPPSPKTYLIISILHTSIQENDWSPNPFELERALKASMVSYDRDVVHLEARQIAAQLHMTDLFKTQMGTQDNTSGDPDVMILVRYPEFASTTSCINTDFQKVGRLLLTRDQVLNTGSPLLKRMLESEKHQLQAKKAAGILPPGVTHVLNLSPTTDEDDYTIALQHLTITNGVKLWYRSVALGTSYLAVIGHDDACSCTIPRDDEGYPRVISPPDITDPNSDEVCIFDTVAWPIEQDYEINDFCQTRWAANIIRLFRSIANPPGHKDLLLDSAPRMWTLVGLFSKLEMTNYDLLVSMMIYILYSTPL